VTSAENIATLGRVARNLQAPSNIMAQYALVVGITKYDHFRNLDKAATDAEAIAQFLEQHRYTVIRLPRKLVSENENQWAIDPTKKLTAAELSTELKIFLNDRATRQAAVIYFAGHGFRITNPLTDEQLGYLATSDSIQDGQKAIRMNDLNTLIHKSDLGSLVMLLDCCHAGTLIEQRSLLQPTQSIIRQKQNYCLIAACRDFERAREGEQHGIFTAAVLQGLSAGDAVDGEVTSNDLVGFVSRRLSPSGQEVIHAHQGQPILLVTLPKEKLQRLQEKSEASSTIKSNERFVLHKNDISTFTGRTKELKQLESQLLNVSGEKAGKIVFISGSGGWGKSTLASRFANSHQDKFPDGVIGLPVDGKAVHEVARDFARLGGREIAEDEDLSPATIMQEVFAHRRMLLIFDNVDNTDLKVLQPGGLCSLIITTRDRSISGSFRGIPEEAIIDLSEFPDDDARKLIREIVGKRVDDEPEAVDRILEMTENLPLALEIAGCALQQKSKLSLSRYAEYLKEEEDRLEELKHADDVGLNVTASIEVSLKFLEAPDIDLFACLSVSAKDGFSLETAMRAGGLLSHKESRKRLEKLHRFSLLNEVGQERYVFHTLVRIYAQALAQKKDLWDAATKRHAEYFLNLVQSNNVESPEIAKQVTENFEDILQAAQWLRKHATSNDLKESAYQFALDLRPFLLKYSYSKQAIELMKGFQSWAEDLHDWNASVKFKIQQAKYLALLEQFSEAEAVLRNSQDSIKRIADPTKQQQTKAKLLSCLGGILEKQDKLDEAIVVFQEQIEIEEILNDQRSLAIALNRRGRLWQKQNKFEEAIVDFNRASKISESLNDHISLAIALNQLGLLFKDLRKHKEAIEVLNREICIYQELDNQRQLAIALNRLGGLLQQPDSLDLEAAISVFKREIGIDRNLGDQRQLVIGLNCLGRALQQQKNFDEAIVNFKEQIAVAEALNDQKQVATGWGCLGEVYKQYKNFDNAIVAFQHEIRIEEALDNQQKLAISWNRLGGVFKDRDNLEEAIAAFNHCIEIAKKIDDQIIWAINLDCLGSALKKQDKLEEAVIAFEEEIAIAKTISNLRQLAIGWNSLGEVAKQQGYIEKSIFAFLYAATYNELLKDNQQLHSVWKRLGDILRNRDNLAAANAALRRLNPIAKDLKDSLHVAIMLHILGQAYNLMNKLEEAEFVLQESRELLDELSNNEQLLKVLKTLVETFENKQDWKQAEQILRTSYNEAEKLKDISTKEKILRKLGEICSKQESEEKFRFAQSCFRQSINLSREMNDPIRLAQAYNAWGKALRNSGKQKDAVSVLIEGFEELINDIEIHGQRSGKYTDSLRKVTEVLGDTLIKLGRREEALEYCDRASLATGSHDTWINLRNKFFDSAPKKRSKVNSF
jgi:tetratricopeptide (TPR) repeat protein